MIFLLLAILCSAGLPLLFRAFDDWRVNLFWAIPVNYFTCIVVGTIFASGPPDVSALLSQPWFLLAMLQGFILAVNFYLLAYTAQRAGVSVAVLASRLSVAIPAILAFLLHGDSFNAVKTVGLAAALSSLYLCTATGQGFWCYPCVVASTSADSRVLHVRVSLHFAEIYSGPLSRRLVLSRVRHNVLFLCLCDKRCHWSRENSY